MKRTVVAPVSMVKLDIPWLKVPAVTATLPLEVIAAKSASIVPPVWLMPTQFTVAVFSVKVPRLTSTAPLKLRLPAPVEVKVPPSTVKFTPLVVPVLWVTVPLVRVMSTTLVAPSRVPVPTVMVAVAEFKVRLFPRVTVLAPSTRSPCVIVRVPPARSVRLPVALTVSVPRDLAISRS